MNTLPPSNASYAASRRGLKIIVEKENKIGLKNSYWNTSPFYLLGVCLFSLRRISHLMQEISLTVTASTCIVRKKILMNFQNGAMQDFCCMSGDLAHPRHPPARVQVNQSL